MFLETPRFPSCPSFGFVSEPIYVVSVIERSSGIESRNRTWSRPLHRYTATVGPKIGPDVYEVLRFYHAVGGRAYGFRFKDYVDFKSCAADDTVSATDQPILIDTTDSPDSYILVKEYTFGALTQQREIRKPVQGTIIVAEDGSPLTEGADYTIDYSTGVVTLGTSPSGTLTWGGEFDVPVRFDSEFPVEIVSRNAQHYINSAQFLLKELRLAE